MRLLAEMTWEEVEPARMLLAVPLGATEQHGPHLPLGTDTAIAAALAEGLAARRADVIVAPTLPVGASGEHTGFPGTLSLDHESLELALVELVRSADAWAGVVLVNWHGGNAEALAAATTRLEREGRSIVVGPALVAGGHDVHAGRTETSLMLAIAPELVRSDRARAGDRRPLEEVMPELRSGGVGAVSPSGVLGDPAGASAAKGRVLLAALVDDLDARVQALRRTGAPSG